MHSFEQNIWKGFRHLEQYLSSSLRACREERARVSHRTLLRRLGYALDGCSSHT